MKRLLIFLVMTIFLCAVFVAIKNEYARCLPSSGTGMSEVIETKVIDHLFIGSSTFRKGLDIEELEKLGGYSYILSYNGNEPALIQMELAYLLEQGVQIRNLYVDYYPFTAASRVSLSDTRLLLDTDTKFKIELWEQLKSSGGKSSSLYELFVSANNALVLWWPAYITVNRSRNRHGGLIGMKKNHGTTKARLDARPLFGKRDGLQEAQLAAFRRIAEMADEHGMRLYFLEIPKYSRLSNNSDYIELRAGMDSELSAVSGRIIHAADMVFDDNNPDYFTDLVHLSGIGANTYTKVLMANLAEEVPRLDEAE